MKIVLNNKKNDTHKNVKLFVKMSPHSNLHVSGIWEETWQTCKKPTQIQGKCNTPIM